MAEKKKNKKKNGITVEVELPEGIEASVDGREIKVKGAHGQLVKRIQSNITGVKCEDGKIILTVPRDRKKQRALVNTEKGNVMNMIHGVKDKVTYRLKIVYSHFPMGVKVQDKVLVIDNFLGEKHPRKVTILDGVNVEIKGQDVTVSGIDKENVGQTAANMEQTTRIKNLDPRVFQDGIYIVEKDGKPVK